MTDSMVLDIGAQAIKITLLLAGPLLIGAMVVGILVSVFQAITQINEATLTFIPKMLIIVVMLVVLAPWMLNLMREYAFEIYGNVMTWVR